jgi:hypothetical protein
VLDIAIEDASLAGESGEWDIEDLIPVTLPTVSVDVNRDGDDCQQQLVFDDLVLVE